MARIHAALFRPALALLLVLALGALPGGWASLAASAQTPTATLNGTATDGQGNSLGGVTIGLTGPGTYTTTTGNDGKYQIAGIKPGIYSVRATHLGYNEATQENYILLAGTASNLDVSLVQQTVSSLQEIGRVRVSARSSSFNPTPASVVIVPAATFQEQGALGLARVLEELPGLNFAYPIAGGNNAGRTAYAVPTIRDGLPTETSTLLDGHPVGNGDNGATIISFISTYTLGGIELIKGPGAAAPEINNAINGTVNFRTLEPTSRQQGSITFGVDGYGGQFSNWRATGTTLHGKLSYAFDYVVDGTPGPLRSSMMPSTLPATALINGQVQATNPNNAAAAGTFGPPPPIVAGLTNNGIQNNAPWFNSTLLTCCYPISTQFLNRNELAKLRFNFSPNTSLTASYLGDNLTASANGNVNVFFPVNFNPGASYALGANTGQFSAGTNIGTVEQLAAATEGPGETLIRTQPIYQGEFRTGNASNNFVARYYQSLFNFFVVQGSTVAPDLPWNTNLNLFGTVNTCPAGTTFTVATAKCSNGANPTANTFTGQSTPVSFISSNGVCAGATPGTFIGASTPVGANGNTCGTAANPFSAFATPAFNFGGQFDRLHGGTFEYDHFFPNSNTLSISYDQTNHAGFLQGTFGPPNAPAVPAGAWLNNQTFLTRFILNSNKFSATISNYYNIYKEHYSSNASIPVPVPNVTAGTIGTGAFSIANPTPTFQDVSKSLDIPRVGMTFRTDPNLSLRFSTGGSVVPVYLSGINVSNTSPVFNATTSTYANTLANANIRPETAWGYDLGYDWRLGDGLTVISMDVYRTTLQNQIFTTTVVNCYNPTTFAIVSSPDGTCTAIPGSSILFTTQNTNFGFSRYEGLEWTIKRDPPVGFGYTFSGALLRGYPFNISPCFYYTAPNATCTGTIGTNNPVPTVNFGIIAGQNFGSLGSVGNPGAVAAPAPGGLNGGGFPYSQGYAEMHWRSVKGGFLQFAANYYGLQNNYGVPAFLRYDANAASPLFGDPNTKLVMNLFNLGNIWNQTLPGVFQGNAFPLLNNRVGLSNYNPLGPRRLTVSVTHNFDWGR